MKKVWKGFYEDYLTESEKITVEFTISAELENGSFKGKVYEDEFSKFTGDSIDVKGFIEGNLISFVTKYPYLYDYDSEGKILIDKNEKGHEVMYEGYFNEDTGVWSGEWKIETDTVYITPDSYQSVNAFGNWEMKSAKIISPE